MSQKQKAMEEAAKSLDFILAAQLRDQLLDLKEKLSTSA
ncbi:MAG: UvrB/UvrC motif-containing protein [Flavobacteriaceae bacterium]|nr:UvrB/UvrC motif-containing protein [Flavobacteriaceae bacterium]